MRTCLPLACCLLLSLVPPSVLGADQVTVYRCVDARGQVSLSDAPCAQGSEQEVRQMQRPVDGPAPLPPLVAAPGLDPAPVAPAPAPMALRRPEPMYECVTPDGDRYTSDDGEGNPRWVPLWTLGYGGRPTFRGNGASRALNDYQDRRPLGGHVGASPRYTSPPAGNGDRPGRPPRPHRPGYSDFGGAGTWVRDTCRALPQSEVCARLVERRDLIRTRFFNAQEQERNTLRREERGINARLAEDCGR